MSKPKNHNGLFSRLTMIFLLGIIAFIIISITRPMTPKGFAFSLDGQVNDALWQKEASSFYGRHILIVGATIASDVRINPSQLETATFVLLKDTKISDVHARQLLSLPNIAIIRIRNSPITDAAFADLPENNSVERLYLYQTKVGLSTIKSLSKFKTLSSLMLSHMKIDHDIVDSLLQIPNLETLEIYESEISPQDRAELAKKINNFEYTPPKPISPSPPSAPQPPSTSGPVPGT